jgi:hypothetical protein
MDFGDLEAGTTQSMTLTIANDGGQSLLLEELELSGSGSFAVDTGTQRRAIEPGESFAIEVTYTPAGHEIARAELTVVSSDTMSPEIVVPLTANGLAPQIMLSPTLLQFDAMDVGCVFDDTITIHNTGSAPLTIVGIDYSITSDDLEIDLSLDLPLTLGRQESRSIAVRYRPGDELPDAAFLAVESDDPATPEARATITGDALYADETTDQFEQTFHDTDVLLVIDNSCSMDPFQDALASNVASFIEVLDAYAPDFHIAVITTDSAMFRGPFGVMDSETPQLAAAFAAAVMVGTTGQNIERGLSTAAEALNPTMSGDEGVNTGFLRDDAILRVLIVSDEDDQSTDSVANYVDELRSVKQSNQDVLVSAVSGQSSGCSQDGHYADEAPRYEAAISMTEGLSESICIPNWTDTLASPEWLTSGLMRSFVLTSRPVVDTLVVEQNEVPVTEGWTYDAWSNQVVFDDDHIPHAGDDVTLRYHPSACY